MVTELGHFALVLALAVAVLQMVIPLIGAQKGWTGWMAVAEPAATTQFLLIAYAFFALMWAYVTDDFSLRVVVENSHTLKPLLYKIAGTWGNHEGSMLLWVLILSGFGAAAAVFGGNLPPRLKARVLAVQASIGVAFLIFILFTSNPFVRLAFPPMNGQGMNPLLQDPGLAFHPPFLYLGYVGLSMAFSFAIAALIEGRVDAAWARWVRPWTLAAWMFLTIGIAMGSWWSYYVLGWGGFWFWDPVENASLMPWLFAAALLHSAIVVEKREALKSWTILLAILAFGFSLIGTFLVRSGVITSVHAFADDPQRGIYILAILGVFMGGALTLYAARAGAMEAKGLFGVVSRETALILNNVLLAVASLVVFVGTVWPLIAQMAFDRKLSVGPPYFNLVFPPLMIALAVMIPFGTLMPWKRARLARVARPLWAAVALAVALGALAWAMQTGRSALGPVGLGLGAWLVAGSVVDLLSRSGRGPVGARLGRLARLPRADWGRAVAHGGLGIAIFGVCAVLAWQVEVIRVTKVGESFALGPYTVTLNDVHKAQGPNYRATVADVKVSRAGALVTELHPEKRFYPVAGMPTTNAGISRGIFRDLYIVVGDEQADGGYDTRSYIKPFADWIWLGAILMGLGGLLSLTDRRYRVAAGARKPEAAQVAAE
ncbi:heme lyase CcmF/NrfE family subunit [Solirhodobacter olei]|uniref:heme lyase CcmF/NrfE family subunit n=1 Tax=Solirhodobacter olei TaxID=2493082 RepID=UPI000FDB8F51|nr:heme lyase CcmF/NrfE family subunit [Solirhodobacter olei]